MGEVCAFLASQKLKFHSNGVIAQYAIRMNEAGYAQTVFRNRILDRVSAADDGIRFLYFFITALQYSLYRRLGKRLRETEYVHGELGSSAHGVHVAECIGGGSFAVRIRIIYYRREYIDSLD